VGARACGHEHVEVGAIRLAQPGAPRLGRLADDVDRLAEAILARAAELAPARLPELRYRLLLADQHPRGSTTRLVRERLAAAAGGDDVRAEVAQRAQRAVVVLDAGKPALAPTGDVLEEHALDRALRAVGEDLLGRGLHDVDTHRAEP
jgi:hypothetical protein